MSAHYSIVNHAIARIVSTHAPAFLSITQLNQNRRKQRRLTPFRLCLILLCAVLVLAGCGPEEGEGNADMAAETVRIAQAYQANGDLAAARAELEQLDVANPTQYLIFLAEKRADSDAGSTDTAALVNLTLALGLQSGQLMDYAMQYGLLASNVEPMATVAAVPAVQSLQGVTSEDAPPAADIPVAVIATATIPAAVSVEDASNAGSDENSDEGATAEEVPAAANPLPTATAESPTATPVSKPQVQASNGLNVRGGPGTAYPVVGALNSGEQAEIIAKNPEGDWWEVNLPAGGTGWVYGPLVQATGDTGSVAVATNIPEAPPTPTPAPVAEAPAEEPPVVPEQPAEAPPAEAPPAEVPAGNDFVSIERRLWTVEETGGAVDSGGSVRCGEKRELRVIVLDANGGLLNGVAVQAIYGAQEIFVTGNQGKGEGQVEFVLGAGQGVKVIRDVDGREVSSDVVDGMTTHSPEISHSDLIGAHYCTDGPSCDKFNFSAGCWGHHSWTVTFKRKY